MPLPPGTRYRTATTKGGEKVRLAFRGPKRKGQQPIEAKNLRTGATHTPAEFAADRAKPKKRKRKPADIHRAMQRGMDFRV